MGIGSAGGERGILSLPELISSELTQNGSLLVR